jgi:DMSO/TMAO reductase YedYZ molybdopterin-dependent catalytic subunit
MNDVPRSNRRQLAEVGVQPGASWVIAEGADACRMERSVPLSKAKENTLLAYGQVQILTHRF